METAGVDTSVFSATQFVEPLPQKLQTWGLPPMRSSKQPTGAQSQSSRGSITSQQRKGLVMVEQCSQKEIQ